MPSSPGAVLERVTQATEGGETDALTKGEDNPIHPRYMEAALRATLWAATVVADRSMSSVVCSPGFPDNFVKQLRNADEFSDAVSVLSAHDKTFIQNPLGGI